MTAPQATPAEEPDGRPATGGSGPPGQPAGTSRPAQQPPPPGASQPPAATTGPQTGGSHPPVPGGVVQPPVAAGRVQGVPRPAGMASPVASPAVSAPPAAAPSGALGAGGLTSADTQFVTGSQAGAQTNGPTAAAAQWREARSRATQSVRATATVTPPRRPPPAEPAPTRVPVVRSELTVRLLHVVCWQLAVVAVLLAIGRPPPVVAAAVVVAGVTAVLTALPWRGRWLYQWLGLRVAYGLRRRRLASGDAMRALSVELDDPRHALIEYLQPAAVLGEFNLDEEMVATIAHPAGLTAVLELEPGDQTLFAPAARVLPSPLSLLPPAEPNLPPTTIQLVVQVEPTPFGLSNGGSAVEAYRQLTGGQVPMHRRSWLAVQVRRTPEVFGDTELRLALAGAIKRTRRRLRRDELASQLLGTEALLSACATAAGVEASRPGQAGVYGRRLDRDLAHETWKRWTAGDLAQTSFRIARWPSGQWSLDSLLLSLPATVVTLAMSAIRDPVAPDDAPVEMELVLRLAATDDRVLRAAGSRLSELIRDVGGSVERLDGRHRAAAAATLPFGGFLL